MLEFESLDELPEPGPRSIGVPIRFDEIAADRYDSDARCMPHRYRLAHQIQNQLALDTLGRQSEKSRLIVDLGCGTASDGVDILSQTPGPTYVGVDSSPHMLAKAKLKLSRRGLADRSILISHDFRALTPHALGAAIAAFGLRVKPGVIITALSLHHYSDAAKGKVFMLARDVLRHRGTLIVTDLFSSDLASCSALELAIEIDDVRKAEARITRRHRSASLSSTLTETHYVTSNRPSPLLRNVALIQRCGFSKIDIVYRHGQLVVLAARKT